MASYFSYPSCRHSAVGFVVHAQVRSDIRRCDTRQPNCNAISGSTHSMPPGRRNHPFQQPILVVVDLLAYAANVS